MKTLVTGVVTFSLLGLSAPAVIASTPRTKLRYSGCAMLERLLWD